LSAYAGDFPAEIFLQSNDQTGLYFYDAKDASANNASYLFAIKEVGDNSAAGSILDISAYTTSGSTKNTGVLVLGDGDTKIGGPSTYTKYFNVVNCTFAAEGANTVGYWLSDNAVEYSEGADNFEWNASCAIPFANSGTDDIAIDSISLYFDTTAEVGANCDLDLVMYRRRILTSTDNWNDGTSSVVTVQTASDSALASGDNETYTFTTDGTIQTVGNSYFLYFAPGNNGGSCDDIYFKGYSVTYKTGSGGWDNIYVNPLQMSE
jgi:hypothetical protein